MVVRHLGLDPRRWATRIRRNSRRDVDDVAGKTEKYPGHETATHRTRRQVSLSLRIREERDDPLRRIRTRAATGPDAHAQRTVTVDQHWLRFVESLDVHWINRGS